MEEKQINTVPNQRVLKINKEPTDKNHKYTVNNLEAMGQAVKRLQTKAGFKLYMYLAKHQDQYEFALSSSDFMLWSGVAIGAYNSAFNELVKKGYLVKKGEGSNRYIFYDKSSIEDENENPDATVEINKDTKDFKF